MGFWKKALGVGMAAAGVMSGNPALVAGGATIVANDVAAEGEKKAAKQKEDAAKRALAVQQQVHQQTQASFQPYTATGGAAMGTLGNMLGLSPAANTNTAGGSTFAQTSPTSLADGQVDGLEAPVRTGRMGMPRDEAPRSQAREQTASSYASIGDMAGGDVVQLRAPTGEVALVPRAQAPFYLERGAREVGGVA